MLPELSSIECRVLGCLIEKEITTPEYYPLTVNSLMAACNQKSNRSPAMDLNDDTVQITLDTLKSKRLIWERHAQGARVLKYEHNLPGHWVMSPAEVAVLCELLVRGSQTPGELRSRAGRMHAFDDLHEVEETLKSLLTRGDGPFIAELPRQRGTKETRYGHLFCGVPVAAESVESPDAVTENPAAPIFQSRSVVQSTGGDVARVDVLEQDVADLKREMGEMRVEFERFRRQFE